MQDIPHPFPVAYHLLITIPFLLAMASLSAYLPMMKISAIITIKMPTVVANMFLVSLSMSRKIENPLASLSGKQLNTFNFNLCESLNEVYHPWGVIFDRQTKKPP
jgi:hypothetical protein